MTWASASLHTNRVFLHTLMPNFLLIHWPYLFIVIAMLWFPRQWLRVGRWYSKKRSRPKGMVENFASGPAINPSDKSVNLRRELTNKRNYLDILRAAAGAVALFTVCFEPGGSKDGARIFATQAVILLVAVLIQSVRFEGKFSFYAPIFFFVGISVGLSGPFSALFALVLSMAINPIIPNPWVFIFSYTALLLPLGYFFGSSIQGRLLNVTLLALPLILSLLTKRSMVLYGKRAKTT